MLHRRILGVNPTLCKHVLLLVALALASSIANLSWARAVARTPSWDQSHHLTVGLRFAHAIEDGSFLTHFVDVPERYPPLHHLSLALSMLAFVRYALANGRDCRRRVESSTARFSYVGTRSSGSAATVADLQNFELVLLSRQLGSYTRAHFERLQTIPLPDGSELEIYRPQR